MKAVSFLMLSICCALGAGGCNRAAEAPSSVPAPEAPPAAVTTEPPAPLDLSREHISQVASEQGGALTEPEPLLPDMFDTKHTPGVQLDGRLLTDKATEDLNDKVNGAEVTIEIQTR